MFIFHVFGLIIYMEVCLEEAKFECCIVLQHKDNVCKVKMFFYSGGIIGALHVIVNVMQGQTH